ncbi:MAG: hypothetical protein KDK41_10595 [Leptospiraceae bacterium]|nr:hypothetical protein [Leptospiraceae bacterium]
MKIFARIILKLFILLSIVTDFHCKTEYPIVSYLRPQQKFSQGFLDPNNYQWVETGYAFDLEILTQKDKISVPSPLPVGFDSEALKNYKSQKGVPDKKEFSLLEIAQTDLLELAEEGIDLSAFDPEIIEIIKIKRNIFDQACQNAQAKIIFSFMELLSKDNLYMSKNASPLAFVDPRFVPVPSFYTPAHSQIIRNYSEALKKNQIIYEVIREQLFNADHFDCRMAVLFRKKDLILKAPSLQERD